MRKSIHLLWCLPVFACQSDSRSASATTDGGKSESYRSNPGYVVDSALSMDEELRRFRIGIESEPASLEHAHKTRGELVTALLKAAAARDSITLRELHVTRAEFAYLYFPFSKFAAPPYELAPGLAWFQLTSESDRGITKLMQHLTNNEPIIEKIVCDSEARIEEKNRLWGNCITYWRDRKCAHSGRLFGEIIERAGAMKFLSFANDL